MTHNGLIEELAQRLNWTQERVGEVLESTVQIINEKINDGDYVSLQGLGVFDTIMEHEYIYTENDDRYLVPPEIKVTFKPSSSIKKHFQDFKE